MLQSKEEALEALLDRICRRYELSPKREELLQLILKRERLGGTVFQSGIAVPHVVAPELRGLYLGVCIPARPIASDSVHIRVMFLILAGSDGPSSHVNLLATLLRLSQEEPLFSALCAARSASEVLRLLDESGIEVRKDLSVRDVMESPAITVSAYATLADLIDLFDAQSISYAPVVDAEGTFVGEVEAQDLIRAGIPDYAHMIGSLKFAHSFEPFEELRKNEDRILVNEVMREPAGVLDPDDTIVDAVLLLNQKGRRCLPVVRDRAVLGVLSEMDILSKVLRGPE